MKLEFIKMNLVEFSGQGENATHLKVMKEFENDYEQGKQYCLNRGWIVSLNDNSILSVTSKAMFGFKFNALVKKID